MGSRARHNSPSESFTVSYDDPGITNLSLIGDDGSPLLPGASTDTPVVTWNPTPGADAYNVKVVPFSGAGCDYTAAVWSVQTAATAWTPLGSGFTVNNPWPTQGHSMPSGDQNPLGAPGSQYCVQVQAVRFDGNVTGPFSYLGGYNNVAFTFSGYPTGSPCTAPCAGGIGAADYQQVVTGNSRLPLFRWAPISGAQSYIVLVAKDAQFTNVIDEAFTQVPAYAPRNGTSVINYPDTSSKYYWAVLPAPGFNGANATGDPTVVYPQQFDMHSVAPTLIQPLNGSILTTQPTFRWSPVIGAYQYNLYVYDHPGHQVAGSPFTTDGTSFTAANFPTSVDLTWQVRAIDRSGNGLANSTVGNFTTTLEAPTFATITTNPSVSDPVDAIPTLQWDPMPGAVAYDITITAPANGSDIVQSGLDTTAFTPTALRGTGDFAWTVQAEYPTAGGNVASAPSATQRFTRTIGAPVPIATAAGGAHLASISWNPKPAARTYTVQFSTDSSFAQNSVFDAVSDTQNTAVAPLLNLSQYIEGGNVYWRVAARDADGNQGAWTTPQLLTMPALIHLTVTGSVSKGTTTTLKVTARTGAGKAIAGVSVKDGRLRPEGQDAQDRRRRRRELQGKADQVRHNHLCRHQDRCCGLEGAGIGLLAVAW